MSDLRFVAAVKEYALSHYNQDGWDYVVETMEDSEIAVAITRASSASEAIQMMGSLAGLWASRRADFQGEVF